MRIDAYFRIIQELIASSHIVLLSNITYEQRGAFEGFIRGELTFVDGSLLHIREFVDVERSIEWLMYAYQYLNPSRQLVFRYDNTGHHKRLGLSTYPHHKHDGSELHVVISNAPALAEVLREIESRVEL
ncbi:genome sequencing data, contig C329 [Candidatus Moduliflexus flocculans]|uniref:Genome sequencing data, contig C329 n=1 Tax=Candidatus Moduliflexus flocculans TaxID=1499966 RepID=A0A0S6VYA0_9BACT|nr:genome sequencing data, contig C329 [Candidatus Moduliflexus flocculans]